jgi:hypothetical protein
VRIAGAVLLVGCSFRPGAVATSATPDSTTSGSDSTIAPSDIDLRACITVAPLGVNLCPTSLPGGPLEISTNSSIKTDDGTTNNPALTCTMLMGGATPADKCVILAQSITIDAGVTLSAYGGKPLVLAANSIDIEGTLDVASHIGGTTGPASPSSACDRGTNAADPGGGQGGSFGGQGASGGASQYGTPGGTAGNALTISSLQGGCPGGTGGGGASGGAGGGVVLIATSVLTIGNAGRIDASGAAGSGAAANHHGGGGGGSGGLIVLQSGSILLNGNAQVYANGSHGGGGSGGSNPANDGTDPSGATSGGGGGGTGGSNSGAGQTGAYRNSSAVAGSPSLGCTSDCGGGGGGGGLGAIQVHSSTSIGGNTNVSPMPTTY